MPWYAFLFVPFALVFRLISSVRNYLYDQHFLTSFNSPVPTLIVGNLSVGGTGKTPMVEFLIRNLMIELKVASLSRGYGRKTNGFFQADSSSSPSQIGDEPMQIFQKFEGEIPVFVGEDRVAALQKIAKISPDIQLVILDDAFQHRRLRGDFYCLLTPFSSPFSEDHLLPMGRLRESRYGAKRADLIVVTKCPENLSAEDRERFSRNVCRYSDKPIPVFYSKIGYGSPYALEHPLAFGKSVVVISGLANNDSFLKYCSDNYKVLDSMSFPDHHNYNSSDLEKISELTKKHLKEKPVLLTTEKDAVKLKSLSNQGFLREIPIFVLPIEAKFDLEDKEMLLSYIRRKFKKQ
jgi:tetraacyldisaccharide 4'-kinase